MTNIFFAVALIIFGAGCVTEPPVVSIDSGNLDENAGLIIVDEPDPGDIVASPLTITGEAHGTWFFEATFPVELQDADGNVIAQSYVTADGNWMTEDFVSFSATLTFTVPAGVTEGVLYLRKDNPSGLAAYDDEVHFPVSFE